MQSSPRSLLRVAGLIALRISGVAPLACAIDLGDPGDAHEVDRTPRIAGTVRDAEGNPLADVAVRRDGTELGRSDASGRFEIAAASGETVVLTFHKGGFVRGLERVEVVGGPTAVQVTMLAEAEAIAFDADVGGKVEGTRGASFEAPAGVFVDRQGNPVGGMVEIHLTPLNPADPDELAAYPGDGRARMQDGDTVQLESFGVVDVAVRQGETDLTIAPGMGATVEFPLPDPAPSDPPQQVALWGFDDAAGVWVEEGVAELDATRGVYRGTVTHLSPWNCDQPLEATCLRGRVVDDGGDPIPGAYLIARGVDYSGDASAVAGDDGSFCLPVRKNSQVEVTAYVPSGAQQTRQVSSGASDTDIPVACDDPRCQDAGEWVFGQDAGDDGSAGDGGAWQGSCHADEDSRLRMTLSGDVDGDIDWQGSPWFGTCGGLAGSTGNDSTGLWFVDDASMLDVIVTMEAGPAETGTAIPGEVVIMQAVDGTTTNYWFATECTVDVQANEVLAPGLFHVRGTGRCSAPATSYTGMGTVEIADDFEFAGIVVGNDLASDVLLGCCDAYGG